LQHEVAELMRRLRRDGGSPVDYFSDASRVVQVKTALKTNADPNAVDADKAAAVFHLNEQSHAELQRLFARSDELRYSGAHNGNDGIAAEQRHAVIDLVESLHA